MNKHSNKHAMAPWCWGSFGLTPRPAQFAHGVSPLGGKVVIMSLYLANGDARTARTVGCCQRGVFLYLKKEHNVRVLQPKLATQMSNDHAYPFTREAIDIFTYFSLAYRSEKKVRQRVCASTRLARTDLDANLHTHL